MSQETQRVLNGACVVVGVGEGLGAALARRFAESYKIALIARSPHVIRSTAEQITEVGGVARPIQSDATIETEIAASYKRIVRELGAVEILIYNGGRRPIGRLMETTPEVFRKHLAPPCVGGISMGAAGRTVDALSWSGRDSDHGSDGRDPALAELRGVRASQVCGAGPRSGDGARSPSARHPRCVRQCGRRDRHAYAAQISS